MQEGKSELTLNLITGRVLQQRDSWCAHRSALRGRCSVDAC
jgi:hypothetical protein